jgi:hypothetical protein
VNFLNRCLLSYDAFHLIVNVITHNSGEDRRGFYIHHTGETEFPPAVIYPDASARGPTLGDKSTILTGYICRVRRN